MDSLRGQFLVASPHLPDPHFSRSVVLMLQHNSSGAVGVVLNRPTDNTIGDLWQHVGDESCTVEGFVHAGGPVAGPLMALHTNRSLAETEILPGLFVATDRDALTQLVQGTPDRFRLFSGYAGWSAGQLEDELQAGGWLTSPATQSRLFSDAEHLWKRTLDDIGVEILSTVVDRKVMPPDPSLN
ncbi:MAG: hypothetical protein CMJ59_21860 [Planctomycetaceae bacterium]|nr:hypothetical protein [Planctomycetaceae bacterium]